EIKMFLNVLIDWRESSEDKPEPTPNTVTVAEEKKKTISASTVADLLFDLYYAGRDILAGRKWRTALTILAGIGIGAALGVVLGTVVFPGIGRALGGALGAALTAAVTAAGGVLGLSVLGAAAGSWVGQKLSKYMFKEEKRYDVSSRTADKIKK